SPDVNDPGFREIDWDHLVDVYAEQVRALVEGGADFILIETVFDTLNAKAGVMSVRQVEKELGREIPIMMSMTLTDLSGRNLSGHTVEAFWYAIRHAKPLTIGLNCSFGATQLRPHVKTLSEIADTLIMVYPNAGLPNELCEYDEMPQTTAGLVKEWADHGQVNVLGGCCGSTPAHIAAMAQAVQGLAPRRTASPEVATRLAGLEPFIMAA
ncbi:MAG: 5-methyltetrahydrofolate--homocysteine methyltransferase, partial [Novosphingobium sp. 16-62-11]